DMKRACIICLTEKEHTLVPPHTPREISAQTPAQSSVEDHRFCTDCWEDFLRHARRAKLSSMICPVCRGEISVPEVWSKRLELPQRWAQEEEPESAPLPLPVVSVPHFDSRWLWR
ncbi:unnamed protein product, partial [Effrenium voratum]